MTTWKHRPKTKQLKDRSLRCASPYGFVFSDNIEVWISGKAEKRKSKRALNQADL